MLFPALPIVLPIAAIAAVTKFHLSGENLSKYDTPRLPVTFNPKEPSNGADAVKDYLIENFIKPAAGAGTAMEQLAAKRERFDQGGLTRTFDAEFIQDMARFGKTEVDGEWTIVKGADPSRRLLYLHGGANTVGSAISHRPIIVNIAKRTGCVVFAPNYRLMPENKRMDGVTDCRAAYRWILENGPDGPATTKHVAIAGDSAGGNLSLSLVNHIKDAGLRKPDAVVAISPAVDTTFSAPSLKSNFKTDLMLQPLAGPLVKTPKIILLWAGWKMNKISPASPIISPIYGDLSDLPPTLIHVSAHEMLYDDARRYTNKARAQGSDVKLQSWAHMCHVWHIFDEMLPEAHAAFDEIAAFLKENGFSA